MTSPFQPRTSSSWQNYNVHVGADVDIGTVVVSMWAPKRRPLRLTNLHAFVCWNLAQVDQLAGFRLLEIGSAWPTRWISPVGIWLSLANSLDFACWLPVQVGQPVRRSLELGIIGCST